MALVLALIVACTAIGCQAQSLLSVADHERLKEPNLNNAGGVKYSANVSCVLVFNETVHRSLFGAAIAYEVLSPRVHCESLFVNNNNVRNVSLLHTFYGVLVDGLLLNNTEKIPLKIYDHWKRSGWGSDSNTTYYSRAAVEHVFPGEIPFVHQHLRCARLPPYRYWQYDGCTGYYAQLLAGTVIAFVSAVAFLIVFGASAVAFIARRREMYIQIVIYSLATLTCVCNVIVYLVIFAGHRGLEVDRLLELEVLATGLTSPMYYTVGLSWLLAMRVNHNYELPVAFRIFYGLCFFISVTVWVIFFILLQLRPLPEVQLIISQAFSIMGPLGTFVVVLYAGFRLMHRLLLHKEKNKKNVNKLVVFLCLFVLQTLLWTARGALRRQSHGKLVLTNMVIVIGHLNWAAPTLLLANLYFYSNPISLLFPRGDHNKQLHPPGAPSEHYATTEGFSDADINTYVDSLNL